jgi:hypothetical protein
MTGLISNYVMIIWDDSCLDKNLGVDDGRTIRDVFEENKILNFTLTKTDGSTKPHTIWKRMLANQAIWCYYTKNSIFPTSIHDNGDFSSLDADQRRRLVNNEYVCDSMRIIQTELADEDDEGEDDI